MAQESCAIILPQFIAVCVIALKLSGSVSVFGLGERLIQRVKWSGAYLLELCVCAVTRTFWTAPFFTSRTTSTNSSTTSSSSSTTSPPSWRRGAPRSSSNRDWQRRHFVWPISLSSLGSTSWTPASSRFSDSNTSQPFVATVSYFHTKLSNIVSALCFNRYHHHHHLHHRHRYVKRGLNNVNYCNAHGKCQKK